MDDFEKQLKSWKNERLSEAESSLMLERILARPVPSPYARYARAFAYVKKPAGAALLALFILSSSVAYASQKALPGDTLYAVKVKMVEPMVTALTLKPEERLDREAELVERRLTEAEALAREDRLDEEKAEEIERKIEKSSSKFGAVAEEISKKAATTSEKRREKEEELKKGFKEKLDAREDGAEKSKAEDREKIERLKERAVDALERKGKNRQSGD